MKKIIVHTGGVVLFLLFVFSPNSSFWAATTDYLPSVNVVTVEGNQVKLPKTITYLSENNVVKGTVTWQAEESVVFQNPGKYEVVGTVTETGQSAKGIITVFSKLEQVKVAAVGDSITYGFGVDAASQNAYPKQLNNRLGAAYEVRNNGNTGKTLLETGNEPYIRTQEYKNSLLFNPNIVVIQLGTNDTKPANFSKIDNFLTDYVKLIQTYKKTVNQPIIYICLPPKVIGNGAYDIKQPNLEKLLPVIMNVAKEAAVDVSIIDNYAATEQAQEFLPDNVHPNAKGAALLANNVYYSLTGEKNSITNKAVANSYDFTYGAINAVNSNNELYLSNIGNKNWLSYKNVDFSQDTGTGEIQILAAIPYDKTKVQVRIGSPTGEIIGEKLLNKTGNLETWSYQQVEINKRTGIQDIYLVFERPETASHYEIARLSTVDFHYNADQPVELYSSLELEAAIYSKLTNLKLMRPIKLIKNILLNDSTTINLNGHVLNTFNYYIGKNEQIGKRINVEISNGFVLGQSYYGSFYIGESESATAGLNMTVTDVTFNGVLFIQNNVKDTTLSFDGTNTIKSTKGSNVYARNVLFKEGSSYYGSTEGGGSTNGSGSTVIALGAGNYTKKVTIAANAKVELYPGSEGTGYGQNAIYGFSMFEVQEGATFKAIGKQAMLRTEYTLGNAVVLVKKGARFEAKSTEASQGFSYTYGIDYIFDEPSYLNLESHGKKPTNSFMTGLRVSSILYRGTQLLGWENLNFAALPTKKWEHLTEFQLSNIQYGNQMGTIKVGTEEIKATFGSLNNYYRISNQ